MRKDFCYKFLIFASALVWIIMMGSKNVYTAEFIEIQRVFGVSKPEASLAMTFYFLTYSSMQVILFFVMDKINIKWFMLISVFLSGIVTIVVALATGLWQLWWILAINGILQAGIWGMCTAIFSKYLPNDLKPTANLIMNIGTAIAGGISYGSASLFESFKRFHSPFTYLGVILSISAVLYFMAVGMCEKRHSLSQNNGNEKEQCSVEIEKKSLPPFTLISSKRKNVFYVVTFLLSFFIHFVFYGTLNWIPDLLMENFNLSEKISILISVIAPLATIIGPIIAIRHCEKQKNFINVGLLYMSFSLILSFIYIFLFNSNIVLSLLIIIVYLIAINGAVTIIFSVISYKLSDYINAGAHSGLMNAAGGYAAGFAPTVMGAIIDGTGWQFSYIVVFMITLAISLSIYIINLLIKRNKI